MRVFIVYPGHGMATIDVASGLANGFRALGCEVEAYRLENRALWFGKLLAMEDRIKPEARSTAAYIMAGEEIPARILRFEPDLVVVVHGGLLSPENWEALGSLARLFPIHLVLTECPYEDEYFAGHQKWPTKVWANDKCTADRWACGYLPAAYDPVTHHPPAAPVGGCPDVLFVGTGWRERCAFFNSVDWRGIWFQIVGPLDTWEAAEGTPLEHQIENAGIPGAVLWPYYAGAGAVVNLHRMSRKLWDDAGAMRGYSLNPRCYQVPACGGLLLSDARPEFAEVFGGSLPTFETPKQLEALIRHFMDHPDARTEAVEASMLAVRPHTYTARAATILEDVKP